MDPTTIDLRDGPPGRCALVAMPPGPSRDAVLAVLTGTGATVAVSVARGTVLLDAIEARRDALVVVELSRLGEAGLVGLSRTVLRRPSTNIVLLLPGGLGGPSATTLGITAVLEESDVSRLRTVARGALLPTGGQLG